MLAPKSRIQLFFSTGLIDTTRQIGFIWLPLGRQVKTNVDSFSTILTAPS